jgi:hypothetical protein
LLEGIVWKKVGERKRREIISDRKKASIEVILREKFGFGT